MHLFALVGLARPAGVAAYIESNTTFFFGAVALGTLALAISAALALLTQRWLPGSQSGSSPAFAARERMNSRSDSRFR